MLLFRVYESRFGDRRLFLFESSAAHVPFVDQPILLSQVGVGCHQATYVRVEPRGLENDSVLVQLLKAIRLGAEPGNNVPDRFRPGGQIPDPPAATSRFVPASTIRRT